MLSDDAVAELERTNMAWLSHEGQVISCRLYGHIEKLGELPLFRDAYAAYKEACAGNEAWMQDELSKLGPDDWLEMHRFEGMNDGAKSDFVRTVYEAGWIRLGRSYERPAPPVERRFDRRRPTFGSEAPLRWYVEAEGLTEAVRTQRDTLKELSGRLGCDLVCRGMKYQLVNYGTESNPNEHETLMADTPEPSVGRGMGR